MKRKKIMMIVNPVSGRVMLQKKLWNVLELFSNAQLATTVLFTEKQGDAKEFAKNCDETFDTVVCAGGDGTLNEVISGLMENSTFHNLGYLPVGTTNDLATSLGLSKNIMAAANDIITGVPVSIDIGCFNGRFFNYIASFGAFTEASYNAPQEAKNILGHTAYLLEGIMSLGNIRPYKLCFEMDGKKISGEYVFGAICNTTSVGGLIKLDKTLVSLNDGKFEVLLIENPKNLQEFQKIVDDVLKQNFGRGPLKLYHTSRLKITTKEDIDWTLDGEKQEGFKNFEITNIQSAIKLIIPKK